MGGGCTFEVRRGYPFLVNDAAVTASARRGAEEYLGRENVLDLDIWMAAEDFAFYSQAAPACFYRLGIRNERSGIVSTAHTPTFDIDERALDTGPGLMDYLALKEMNDGRRSEERRGGERVGKHV